MTSVNAECLPGKDYEKTVDAPNSKPPGASDLVLRPHSGLDPLKSEEALGLLTLRRVFQDRLRLRTQTFRQALQHLIDDFRRSTASVLSSRNRFGRTQTNHPRLPFRTRSSRSNPKASPDRLMAVPILMLLAWPAGSKCAPPSSTEGNADVLRNKSSGTRHAMS